MASRLDLWIDETIDRALKLDQQGLDGEKRRAIELFYVVSLAAIVISVSFSVLFVVLDNPPVAAVAGVTTLILASVRISVQRKWIAVRTAVLLYCLVSLAAVCINSLPFGGLGAPSMAWVPVFVIFAFQLLGRGSALFFALVAFGVLAGLGMQHLEVEFTTAELLPYRLFSMLLALGFAIVFGVSVDRVRRRAVERLTVANADLARATQAAEQANRAKTEFLATVSHELRTPLHAITSITDLMSRDDSLAPSHQERTATAREAARSLLGLVDDLLDRAALEVGRVTLRPAACNLTAIATEVRDLLSFRAVEKGIRISLAPHDPLPTVLADPARVRQILMNIVGNAIKFVEAGSIEVALAAKEDAGLVLVTISVTDTGPGIPDDRLEEIFERFERGAGLTEGSGLGLAIARDLLRLMGGDLVVRSTPGVGSTFVATIRAPRVENDESLRGRRILLADDEGVSQRVTTWLLESLGCTVDRADGGLEASRLAGERDYDAILLDCNMPDASGFDTARRIRAAGRTDVPILAFTAGAEDKDGAFAAGMNDLLQKPIDRENLRALLLKHMRVAEGKLTDASAGTR